MEKPLFKADASDTLTCITEDKIEIEQGSSATFENRPIYSHSMTHNFASQHCTAATGEVSKCVEDNCASNKLIRFSNTSSGSDIFDQTQYCFTKAT